MVIALGVQAQHHGPREGKGKPRHPEVTEMVGDLSSSQKRTLEGLTSESKERVDKLRAQQKAVRDSIALYMDRDGDQSKLLYPLFDREAKLQSLISREMYATKVRIDEVLTPAQRQQVRQRNHRKGGKK